MNPSSIFSTCTCGFINVNVILNVKLRVPILNFYAKKETNKYDTLFCNYDSQIIQADGESQI